MCRFQLCVKTVHLEASTVTSVPALVAVVTPTPRSCSPAKHVMRHCSARSLSLAQISFQALMVYYDYVVYPFCLPVVQTLGVLCSVIVSLPSGLSPFTIDMWSISPSIHPPMHPNIHSKSCQVQKPNYLFSAFTPVLNIAVTFALHHLLHFLFQNHGIQKT